MLNLLGKPRYSTRFLGLARGDKSALGLATVFQMIYPGAPSIYYGDEIGMTGGHDPANRGRISWTQTRKLGSGELLHEFQRLIALRRQRPALRRGSFQFLWAADGVIAVARQLDNETMIALFNASRETRRLDLPLGQLVPDETVVMECWGPDTVRVEGGMLRQMELAPRSARILATPLSKSAS